MATKKQKEQSTDSLLKDYFALASERHYTEARTYSFGSVENKNLATVARLERRISDSLPGEVSPQCKLEIGRVGSPKPKKTVAPPEMPQDPNAEPDDDIEGGDGEE